MIPNKEKIGQIKHNIFYRSQNAIQDYTIFDWHVHGGVIDTDRINSSQALAIDFWGCLKISPQKDSIINNLFNKNCINWDIEFEFTDKTLMSEIKPTQIDIKIESDSCVIILESKFTENNGSNCSQLKTNKTGLKQCSGGYEEQINPVNNIKSKCALTGKKIRYWDYIDLLTEFDKTITYNPCPFRKGEYQWMRNICFAEAYSQKYNNKQIESYLVYYKSNKCPISAKVDNETFLGNLKGKILNSKAFKSISYNDLVLSVISFTALTYPEEKQVWLDLQEWMNKKEKEI
jgi:hypothetical protein